MRIVFQEHRKPWIKVQRKLPTGHRTFLMVCRDPFRLWLKGTFLIGGKR